MQGDAESAQYHVAVGDHNTVSTSSMYFNQTTNATPTAGDERSVVENEMACRVFLFVVYVVFLGAMCIFGLIGNTLSFMVLQWEKQNYVATFLLQAMAVLDNLFLLVAGYSQIFAAVAFFVGLSEHSILAYNAAYIWPLVHITQMGTVWITVLIAFNRYIAICKPFQAPKLCTITRVRLQVLLMVVCIIVYNIPRFLENRIIDTVSKETGETMKIAEQTGMMKDDLYQLIYRSLLYCLFVFLGPLVILIILNTCLVRELMRARKRLLERQLPASMTGEDQENNLTLVMIVIIIIFLVCQTPGFLNQLLEFMLDEGHYRCGKAYFTVVHISNLIISANSSLNFVVYCIFRKQFRQRLRAFCHRDHTQSLIMTDAYHCNGRTASIYTRDNINPVQPL